jgi:putative tricarboxylic transport membrane protein
LVILECFLTLFSPLPFLAMSLGVAWGIFLGATPGFGATIGIALLIPFTFGVDPNVALSMMAGVYAGAIYGGGITSIMVGVPGTAAAAATVMDGFAMTQKGESNKALTTSVVSSAFGGIFGGLCLLLFAPMLARVSLLFGPAEYAVLAIFGLTVIASLTSGSILKGFLAGAFGLILGTVGLDPVTGDSRFTFDQAYLFDGLPLIPVILSLFAFPRCILMIRQTIKHGPTTLARGIVANGGPRMSLREICGLWKTMVQSSIIGTIIGIIPGTGAAIACWIGYAYAKQRSKHPEKFGTGIAEGVAAAEAANNAVEGGSMVPTLTLSIPGNDTAAVMIGALMIHGLTPGPELFTKYAVITYTYILAVIFCNFIMLAMGLYAARLFARLAYVPLIILGPIMLLVTILGSYATRQYVFDMWITVLLGTVCSLLSLAKYPMPPILLGVILGPLAEKGFRRAMILSQGDWTVFLTRPICLIMLLVSALSIYVGLRLSKRSGEMVFG